MIKRKGDTPPDWWRQAGCWPAHVSQLHWEPAFTPGSEGPRGCSSGGSGGFGGSPVFSAEGKASLNISSLVLYDRKETGRQDKCPVQEHGSRVHSAGVVPGR